jgi:hypothetical protein
MNLTQQELISIPTRRVGSMTYMQVYIANKFKATFGDLALKVDAQGVYLEG